MALTNLIGGHTNSYHTYGLEESLRGIAAAGFKHVELSAVAGWTEHVPLEADDKTLGEIQAILKEYDLTPISLSGHSDLTTKEGLEIGKQAVNLCERLGLRIMNTAIGGHYSEDEDEEAFMGNIHELADYAAQRNVLIGIEIHGDITSSGKRAIPIIEKIGRENARINYDTANVEFYGGTAAVDDLPATIPYMIHLHLKDYGGGERVWDFPALGEGTIDFERIVAILEKGGYSAPISVEIEFKGEPWPPLAEVDRAMKQSYDKLAALGLV